MKTGPKPMRHVTMKDVARLAGVSKSAVSKAINNKPDISPKLKKRIREICEKHGYQINFRIQDLVKERITGKTDNIAFVLAGIEFSDPAYSKIIDGIAVGLEGQNLRLLLEPLSGDERSVYDFPPILRDGRVDGFLLSGTLNKPLMKAIRKLDIPFAVLGTYQQNLIGDAVNITVDTSTGIAGIAKVLRRHGRSRIAFFAENPDNFIQELWFKHLKTALKDEGLEFDDALHYENSGAFTGAAPILAPVFERKDLPFDSIVCLDYRTAQEISHLAYGHSREFGVPPIILATSDAYERHTPLIPTIYYVNRLAEIATRGTAILRELIDGADSKSKTIKIPSHHTQLITPKI